MSVCRMDLLDSSTWVLRSWVSGLRPTANDQRLSARSGGLFLFFFLAGAGQDAEHFLFAHDDEVFTIQLDFGAGILPEQDAVAFFDSEGTDLAVLVDLALAGRHHFALLRLFLGRVGDDDATAGGFAFCNAPHQNAVMERGEFRHGFKLLSE